MTTKLKATIEDLYRVPEHGKAELVNGEIVRYMPTGAMPARAGGFIYAGLLNHELQTRSGHALPDNTGFVVSLPNRRSLSPDAAWYVGDIRSMRFLEGAPVFAVEVRSENDYGESAEQEMADKRNDYFAAGTLVVWDVDLISDDVIRSYESTDPENPRIYRRGEVANAEAAVPGWTILVDTLFS